MTIYINGRWLLNASTGVERYAYEITRALHHEGAAIVLICPRRGNIHRDYDISGIPVIRFGYGHSHVWEQLVLPWFFIGRRKYILLSLMGLGSLAVRKKVMTVHDLSFLYNPAWFSRSYRIFYSIMTPLAIRTSRKIITVSDFSRQEMLRFYPWLNPSKVEVVYNAVDRTCFVPVDSPKSDYLLTVASLDPRKNLLRLSRAHKGTRIPLLLAGGSGRAFATEQHSDTEMQMLGSVSQEKLIDLYQHARALVYISLYEGFGLPPIEAMAAGCPVVAADIPVLREVCHDAAIYCDPTDLNSIRAALQEAYTLDDSKRQTMQAKGFENIKRFSWQSSARKLIQVLS